MENNEQTNSSQPELWMMGPVPGIPPLLQPVAHALLQARMEIHGFMDQFPEDLLWEEPGGCASVAFHLQHIPGVLDRLFTYADERPLSNAQLKYLSEEGLEQPDILLADLLATLDHQVEESLYYLAGVDESQLTSFRPVGRQKRPSTLLGLLFHAAEHTMRHTGQLLVTSRIMTNDE